MPFIEGCGREQTILFPEVLDDYVGVENPVRFIDAFVRSLDLRELGFERAIPLNTGRPPYDPADLLALYIYGYLYALRSSRKLERETQRNVELMWLLRKLQPDFKTIADFRRDNKEAIRQVCRQFTLVCKRMDLFSAELVAIDGSKFRAVNSKDQSVTRDTVKEIMRETDEKIDQYLGELDSTDEAQGVTSEARGGHITERLRDLQQRKTECETYLREMDRLGQNDLSLSDPDSRRMMMANRLTEVCYNAQIAVDEKNKLIVAEDVTNEPCDRYALAPMGRQAQEMLGVSDLAVVADRGYTNLEQVKECLSMGIVPHVEKTKNSNNYKLGLFTKEDFTYDPATDTYRCPSGEDLRPIGWQRKRNGQRVTVYRNAQACRQCPIRQQCTRGPMRRIERQPDENIAEQMHARVAANPEVQRRRKALVEHPFGIMKQALNFRQFLTRGIGNVRTEFSLVVLAYNLRRVVNLLTVPAMIGALR